MEHRIIITLVDVGADETNGDRALGALEERCPQFGPSVSIDRADQTLSVTLSTDADDAPGALEQIMPRAGETLRWCFPSARTVAVTAAAVDVADERELEPA